MSKMLKGEISMRIAIIGAGSIGSFLARHLAEQKHDVFLIDTDPKVLQKTARTADVATRLGSGSDWRMLQELALGGCELLLAVTDSDETNFFACRVGKQLGFKRTAARVRQAHLLDRRQVDCAELFGIDHFIGSDLLTAQEIVRRVLYPGTFEVHNFVHGAVQMQTVRMVEGLPFLGRKISSIDLGRDLLIAIIRRRRGGEELILFPKGQDEIMAGDEVTFVGSASSLSSYAGWLGTPHKRVEAVALTGAGTTSIQVAELLLERGIRVRFFEPDEERCIKIAEKLPEAVVLNIDPTDLASLEAEKLDSVDLFVACGPSTESNLFLAVLAKKAGAREVVSLISDASYAPLLSSLAIPYAVSERQSLLSRIDSILHAETVLSIASFYDGKAQIMEVKISNDSPLIGIPLMELTHLFPKKFLIAVIENRGRVLIARGSSVLSPGDIAIVVLAPQHIEKLKELF